MKQLDAVQQQIEQNPNFFYYRSSGPNYIRILDTPRAWGGEFGKGVMAQAFAKQAELERAVVEIIQKARYRCDVASLNPPDADWTRPILAAMDAALTAPMGRHGHSTQFRFLFGQTPLHPVEDPKYTELKAALLRLVRARRSAWEAPPDIWLGRFYRLQDGIWSQVTRALNYASAGIFGDDAMSDADVKMTWNHAKVVAVDGSETLVGGHNLNMDLFRSYPPVHDVSVVVHGDAAIGSQRFLNGMWTSGTDRLVVETLDSQSVAWHRADSGPTNDPLADPQAVSYVADRCATLIRLHESHPSNALPAQEAITPPDQDLQTLIDLDKPVFTDDLPYGDVYEQIQEYKLATSMLAVGKYWQGANYLSASEVMKEVLIKGAQHTIRMSQMDLISAWKKNWSDHVVCQWLIEALLANPQLSVQVVVSGLDAGAGAEGDQYSFGSGAGRTFALIEYYMTHDVATDRLLPDADGARHAALARLQIAPLFFTSVPAGQTTEGVSYRWPDLNEDGYTATLKQPPLSRVPPNQGTIGSGLWAAIQATGYIFAKVPSAPGNHAKIMIVDDEVYVVGSDNLYPGALSEFNYLVAGGDVVNELIATYWSPLWQYSSPHAVTAGSAAQTVTALGVVGYLDSAGAVHLRAYYPDPPGTLLERANDGSGWFTGELSVESASAATGLAAVSWSDSGGVHERVYFQDTRGTLDEYMYEPAKGRSAGGFSVQDVTAGTDLAAVQWSDTNGVHLRVYYQDAQGGLRERGSDAGASWYEGEFSVQGAAPGTGVAAVQWSDSGGVHVRVYYQDAQSRLRERGTDAGGSWYDGQFSVEGAAADTNLAVVGWSDASGVHLRVYYQDAQYALLERATDQGTTWYDGQFVGPDAAASSGLAAMQWTDGAGVHLRVYYEDTQSTLCEQAYDPGTGWHARGTFGG